MIRRPSDPQDARRHFPRRFASLVILAAVVFVAVFLLNRPPVEPVAQPVTQSVDTTELIRVDDRLVLRAAPTEPFTGWMTEPYPDGSLKSRSEVFEGQLHGISEGFHTNGVLQVREHFVAGISEGTVQKWYSDGAPLSEGTAHQGRLEGTFRRWHPNGVLAEEVVLREGLPHGLSKAWYPSGCLKAEAELDAGNLVRQKFWEDGAQPPIATLAPAGTPP